MQGHAVVGMEQNDVESGIFMTALTEENRDPYRLTIDTG